MKHSAELATDVERHPLEPFLPQNTKVLFLGSFPPQQKRWCMSFFYPNWINDHWRLTGEVFFNDRDYFVDTAHKTFKLEAIKTFLQEKGIGYYDTACAVRRLKDNAADQFLEIVTPTDIAKLTEGLNELRLIVTTGELATTTICRQLHIDTIPKVGTSTRITSLPKRGNPPTQTVSLYRLPSSSRAYPLAFDKKAEAYRQMYRAAGLLDS